MTKVLRRVGFGEVVGEGSAPNENAPAQEAAPEEPQVEDSEDFGEEEKQE